MAVTTIIVPSSSQAMPPHEKNWLNVSMSDVTRGDERAAALLLVVGQVEPEDVVEHPHAQRVQGLLGADGEADDGTPHGDAGDRDDHRGDRAQGGDPPDVDLSVDVAGVDALLDEDGHGQPAPGADEGEEDGQQRPPPQLRAGPPPAPDRLGGAPERGAVRGDLRLGRGHAGAHRAVPSLSARSRS